MTPPLVANEMPVWHWSPAPFAPGGEAVPKLGDNDVPARNETVSGPSSLYWNDDQHSAQAYSIDDSYNNWVSKNREHLGELQNSELDQHSEFAGTSSTTVHNHANASERSLNRALYSDRDLINQVTVLSSQMADVPESSIGLRSYSSDDSCPPFTLVPTDSFLPAFQDRAFQSAADYYCAADSTPAIQQQVPMDSSELAATHPISSIDQPLQTLFQSSLDTVPEKAIRLESETVDRHSGALAEGKLAKLAKKQKDWVEHYCILSCKPREGADFGGIDFAYMLEFYPSRESTIAGHPVESIHAGHAIIKFVQGDATVV